MSSSPAKTTFISYYTIIRKEVVRFTRIWSQTLLPPVISQSLYYLIFGKFIGSRIGTIEGISYMSFIIPGLVMMSVINNSFGNVVSSFYGAKFQRSIDELLVSSTPNWVIIAGYTTGGVLRGMIVGTLVFCVSIFFAHPVIQHLGLILLFIILTSIVFSLAGLFNAIFAKSFDDISIFPTFVLMPLTYLGGVFYSVNSLAEPWQTISKLNPILYLVNGFRYGFFGISDVSVGLSVAVLFAMAAILITVNLYILEKGIGLKN
jgi:ABC-2 type transport system permease protein